MNTFDSFREKLQNVNTRLSKIQINSQSITIFREALNDPELLSKLSKSISSFSNTRTGRWTIITLTSFTFLVTFVPGQYKSYSVSQLLLSQYKSEEAQLPTLRLAANRQISKYRQLQLKQKLSNQYFDNSARILFLPEVIRSAASSHQLDLLSFKPYSSEASSSPQVQSQPIPSTAPEGPASAQKSPNSFSSTIYFIQVRGDYLRVLNFLSELQNFNSYLIFKSSKFTSTSLVSSAAASSVLPNSNGEVVLELTFEVPTQDFTGSVETATPPRPQMNN